jgi:O-antigen ligase
LGYLAPIVNQIVFLIIVFSVLVLAIYRLEWALWLLIVELVIGSKGYLFFFAAGDVKISLRIALWSVIMLVWLGQTVYSLVKNRNVKMEFAAFISILKRPTNKYFGLLAVFILWGAINGIFINHNNLRDIFYDFNGWLYFLTIFPLAKIFKNHESLKKLFPVILAALVWLSFKTLLASFIFSHAALDSAAFRFYRWIRTSGVGEITQVKGGFFRIFFQSQIFSLIAFLTLMLTATKGIIGNKFSDLLKQKKFLIISFGAILFLATIILSMSRSFWLGLAVGSVCVLIYLLRQTSNAKTSFLNKSLFSATKFIIWYASITVLSFFLIITIVTFPVPTPLGGFDTASLFAARASDSSESAILSRWELLPKLSREIAGAPLFGQGFGKTITYQSKDPRQMQLPTKGLYTTYAFEWGWLDFWLKLGIFGLVIYLTLIVKIIRHLFMNFKESDFRPIYLGLGIGLIVVSAVHFFSPYLGHPLGIILVLLAYILPRAEALAGQ